MIFAVETALIAGAATRSAVLPGAAILQVTLAAGFFAIFAVVSGQWIFAATTVLYIFYQISFVRSLAGMLSDKLMSENERGALLICSQSTNA